jgi:hypothetical protein
LLQDVVIVRVLGALGLAALVLVAAGCGGTKAPAVASLGAAATTTTSSGGSSDTPTNGSFQRFVRCLQLHGVNAQIGDGGRGVSITGGPGTKPLMGKAQQACRKYLPGGGPKAMTPAQQARALQAMRALSVCMRKHGFPTFPDPSSTGGLQLNASSGLDPRSPRFQAAMNKCSPNGGPKGKGGPGSFSFRVATP